MQSRVQSAKTINDGWRVEKAYGLRRGESIIVELLSYSDYRDWGRRDVSIDDWLATGWKLGQNADEVDGRWSDFEGFGCYPSLCSLQSDFVQYSLFFSFRALLNLIPFSSQFLTARKPFYCKIPATIMYVVRSEVGSFHGLQSLAENRIKWLTG